MSDTGQKENSLIVAYDRAARILRAAEPDEVCAKTGALFQNRIYRITFLNEPYEISTPEVQFITPAAATIIEVLILHYLTTAGAGPAGEDFISFSCIPDGMFYYKSFQQRALNKLISKFGSVPEKLLDAGEAVGGKKWNIGDYSVLIPVFPKIDVAVQIFKSDDEFPAEANILFSDNIVNFLPAEDTAFLGGYLTSILSRTIK